MNFLSGLTQRGKSSACKTADSSKYSLLLVDDDFDNANKIEEALSDSSVVNINLCHVDSALEAIDQLMARQFDIILLDSSLPDSPRLECLHQIRELAADAPIIVLAERSDEKAAESVRGLCADHCLYKDDLTHRTVTRAVYQSLNHPHRNCGNVQGSHKKASEFAPKGNESSPPPTRDGRSPQTRDDLPHDLRAILTIISEYCAIVRDGLVGPVSAEQHKYLELAVDRIDDLNTIVTCALEMDLLETGTRSVRRESSSLYAIMDGLLPGIKRTAAIRNITVHIELPDELPNLYCDAEFMSRAIVTLARGAMRNVLESGTLEIAARLIPAESEVAIEMRFSNPGAAAEPADAPSVCPRPINQRWISWVAKVVHLNLSELQVDDSMSGAVSYRFAIPFADPEAVIGRYIQNRRKEISSPRCISLVSVDFPHDLKADQVNTIEELFQGIMQREDLLFRLDSNRWLLVAEVEQGNEDMPLVHIRDAWIEVNQNRSEPLPRVNSALKAFYHILPIATEKVVAQAPDKEAEPDVRSSASRRILLVDDEPNLIQALSLRLNLLGFEVITASDGCEGLKLANEQLPGLIVLDIRMPKMDGLTMLDHLNACDETAKIPVIMVSASHVDRRQALQRGAKYFLEKPYDSQVLLATIAAVLSDLAHGLAT